MKELVVLGFASRQLAEEARARSAELDREGALNLDGAALAYRRHDGRIEVVQPMRLALVGAASGAVSGAVLGMLLLAPVLFAAVGAVAGAAGAGLSALGLNQWFLRQVDETLEPGRAALFVVVSGGSRESYDALGPLLEDISAKFDGEPCCAYMGSDGAGHFVKMVHNGIEYADMQFIAEAYDLLRGAGLEPARIAEVFREWNTGDLDSFLIEITAEVLGHVDAATGRPFVDVVADAAEQKGTGRWTVQSALELGVPVNAIAEAVFARSASGHLRLREAARSALSGPGGGPVDDPKQPVEDVRAALWASKVVAYAQGLDQLRAASDAYHWGVDVATVARIWRAGCIIRARLLERIRQAYADGNLPTLLADPGVAEELGQAQDGWRRAVSLAAARGVPVPGFASALAYYDTARRDRLPAALVQGLRDFFGAHTYRRVDREGVFHTLWSEDRTEQEV